MHPLWNSDEFRYDPMIWTFDIWNEFDRIIKKRVAYLHDIRTYRASLTSFAFIVKTAWIKHDYVSKGLTFQYKKSQNLSTPANISKQKELPVLFKNSLFQNKSQNLLPHQYFSKQKYQNHTLFTSDFLVFSFSIISVLSWRDCV